ncbi:hypothetical protein SB18R_03220 [Pseudomonas oryzihabitans]|nr:hypothetical protein SB9_12455 [Pseudomonas psychrotolerans]KTT78257.1 hypothetical protein SB18R_03220 [Pseudomonas psychrotolerans]
MAVKRFLRMVNGRLQQIAGVVVSSGSSNAGDLVALGDNGRLDDSVMPAGVGANTQPLVASGAIGAGKFVNFFQDSSTSPSTLKMRLADNSNGRVAHGFVLSAVADAATGIAYPMDAVNSALSGLSPGVEYYLGTSGGIITPALDETASANQGVGKVSQYVGIAKSATELVTNDSDAVIL